MAGLAQTNLHNVENSLIFHIFVEGLTRIESLIMYTNIKKIWKLFFANQYSPQCHIGQIFAQGLQVQQQVYLNLISEYHLNRISVNTKILISGHVLS